MNEQNTGRGHSHFDRQGKHTESSPFADIIMHFPFPNRATNTHVPTYDDMRIYEGKQRLSPWFTN